MEIKAVSKYVRMTPTKARDLTRAITGKSVGEALQVVELNKRKAAVCIGKTLKSAIANAENNHNLDVDSLVVAEASVGKSVTMKRFHTRGRGKSTRILKPFSRLRIVVREVEEA